MPAKQNWRPFEDVRKDVRLLSLKNLRSWQQHAAANRASMRANGIPSRPNIIYKREWRGWADFLGYRGKRSYNTQPFEEARKSARLQKFAKTEQWWEWTRSADFPKDLPRYPHLTYPEWISWADFLGYGIGEVPRLRYVRTRAAFEEARQKARRLGFKTMQEWQMHARKNRTRDNPISPHFTYKKVGWTGWKDWLGVEEWLPFAALKSDARKLGFTNALQWQEYARGQNDDRIPICPDAVYEKDGWASWGDFLGYEDRAERRNLPEELTEFIKEMLPYREALDESIWYMLLQDNGLADIAQRQLRCTSMHATIQALATDPNILDRVEAARDEATALTPAVVAVSLETIADDELPAIEDRTPDYIPRLTADSVRVIDNLPDSTPPSVIEWATTKLLANLRTDYLQNGEASVRAIIESYPKGKHFAELSQTLTKELEQLHALNVPEWRLEIDGARREPTPMQLYTAVRVRDAKVWGNWSGTGSGKTASAGLAAFAVDSRLTLVIVNNSNVEQWKTELEHCFRDTRVVFDLKDVRKARGSFLILNYDKFSVKGARKLVREIVALRPDFIVLDEVSLVKQRGGVAKSNRRERVVSLRRQLANARVLVMSASPAINDLNEPVSILELALNKPDMQVRTRPTIRNAMNVFYLLCKYGLRYKPDSSHAIARIEVPTSGNDLREKLSECGSDILLIEQTLMPAKLEAVRKYIHPGTVIYTQYIAEIAPMIQAFVEKLGLTVAQFTGNESSAAREEIKNDFMRGTVQVLIGSSAMMLGVDGLQTRSNRIIVVSPPWTSAAMEQVEGRIIRPGSAFHSVEVITPRVILRVGENEWSWDNDRYRRIESKRDLASCATEGRVPSMVHMSENKFARLRMQTLADFEAQAKSEVLQETTA